MASFRRLCRSSPWKWDSVRFAWESWDAAGATEPWAPGQPAGPVTAMLKRPASVRVEDAQGRLLFADTGRSDSNDSAFISATRDAWLLPPKLLSPVYDNDGLVSRRPEAAYVIPTLPAVGWNAVLDPVELAGCAPGPADLPFPHPLIIHELVRASDADGRLGWEAVVSPGRLYEPTVARAPLVADGRCRVRIDMATGICTGSQRLEGPVAGRGHALRILAVNEYMIDDLFARPEEPLTDVRQHIRWVVGGQQPA